MEKFLIATGKTIDLAIQAALDQLSMDRDSVSVEVLENAKSGFLGIGAQPAKVKVSYEVPDEEPKPALSSASRSKPKKESAPAAQSADAPRVIAPAAPKQEQPRVIAPAAPQQHLPAARFIHIRRHHAAFLFAHHRAHGHLDNQIRPPAALAAAAAAVLARLRLVFTAKAEIQQGVHVFIRQQHHIAAPAAVAAVRPAVLHKFFPVKGNAAVAAVAGLGDQGRVINKRSHRNLPLFFKQFSIPQLPRFRNGRAK